MTFYESLCNNVKNSSMVDREMYQLGLSLDSFKAIKNGALPNIDTMKDLCDRLNVPVKVCVKNVDGISEELLKTIDFGANKDTKANLTKYQIAVECPNSTGSDLPCALDSLREIAYRISVHSLTCSGFSANSVSFCTGLSNAFEIASTAIIQGLVEDDSFIPALFAFFHFGGFTAEIHKTEAYIKAVANNGKYCEDKVTLLRLFTLNKE